ncbi:MAG: complement resistance protein TraT [Burkholderiales bacterium]|nr:complement resistance protein TraT [Burkholderiales bacterium]
MRSVNKSIVKTLINGVLIVDLISCSAISTEIHHSNLNVESKMSNSIFLDPVDENQQTIYIQIKNTSTENLANLTAQIKQNLQNGGWVVVNNPTKAHDLLQVNVLQYGQAKNSKEVEKATMSGFGSVVTGALAGVAVGYFAGSTPWGVGIGLGVAAASFAADELVTTKTYSLITDVQVSVRNANALKKYNTRISSMADKVNLKFEEAKPVLVNQLSKEIANIFVENE